MDQMKGSKQNIFIKDEDKNYQEGMNSKGIPQDLQRNISETDEKNNLLNSSTTNFQDARSLKTMAPVLPFSKFHQSGLANDVDNNEEGVFRNLIIKSFEKIQMAQSNGEEEESYGMAKEALQYLNDVNNQLNEATSNKNIAMDRQSIDLTLEDIMRRINNQTMVTDIFQSKIEVLSSGALRVVVNFLKKYANSIMIRQKEVGHENMESVLDYIRESKKGFNSKNTRNASDALALRFLQGINISPRKP